MKLSITREQHKGVTEELSEEPDLWKAGLEHITWPLQTSVPELQTQFLQIEPRENKCPFLSLAIP